MSLPPEVPEVVLLQERLTAEEVRAREANAQAAILRGQLESACGAPSVECAKLEGDIVSECSELNLVRHKTVVSDRVSETLRSERDELELQLKLALAKLRVDRDIIRELSADANLPFEHDHSAPLHFTDRASQFAQARNCLQLKRDATVSQLQREWAESQRQCENTESQLAEELTALRGENEALKEELAHMGRQSGAEREALLQKPESTRTAAGPHPVNARLECGLVCEPSGTSGGPGDLQGQLIRLEREWDSLEQCLGSGGAAQREAETHYKNAQSELAALRPRLVRAERERNMLRLQLDDTIVELHLLRQQSDTFVMDRDVISADRDALQQLLTNVNARVGDEKFELLRRCADLEARLVADQERSDYQQDALGEQYAIALAEADARLEGVEADRGLLLRQLADAARSSSALQKTLAEMEQRLADMEVSAEREALRWQLRSARSALSARESDLEHVMAQSRACDELLASAAQEAEELQSELLWPAASDGLGLLGEGKTRVGSSAVMYREREWKVAAQQRALDRVREWKRRARETKATSCPEMQKTWSGRKLIRPVHRR